MTLTYTINVTDPQQTTYLEMSRCDGITNAGHQCTLKSTDGHNYCKIHLKKMHKEGLLQNITMSTLDFVSQIPVLKKLKPKLTNKSYFLDLIIKSMDKNPNLVVSGFKFKDIYSCVVAVNGGYHHPNGSGKEMTKEAFFGNIRTCIEEHSPCSRQYYFKGGQRTYNDVTKRNNYFHNNLLLTNNNNCKWCSGQVRGDVWFYRPTPDDMFPAEEIIETASKGRIVGYRGASCSDRQHNVYTKRCLF